MTMYYHLIICLGRELDQRVMTSSRRASQIWYKTGWRQKLHQVTILL